HTKGAIQLSIPLTYNAWEDEVVVQLNEQFTETLDVIKWAYDTYAADDLVYACSFGAEGIVLIDLISKIKKDATIIFLDTDVHFKETYQLIDQVKLTYPSLNIQLVKPNITLEE